MFTAFKKKKEDSFIEEELISALKNDHIHISKDRIKKAREGNGEEIYEIGCKYYENKNYPKALIWFRKAVLQNNSHAQNQIGYMYRNGLGVAVDYDRAMEWYLKTANNGEVAGQNNVGYMYHHGLGVPVDYKLAMEWYLKAAYSGNKTAANHIGSMYRDGLGVTVNYLLAMKWYNKAATKGEAAAENNIGYMYQYGLGVIVDYKLAMEWYLKAAYGGYYTAANNIASMYRDGLGVSVDYDLAMKWYRKADANDIDQATSNIGWMYHKGYGVPIDYQLAMEWYQKAILKGSLRVYTRIGLLYEHGLGVSKDLQYAFDCFKKGANTATGAAECQYQLGYFYENQEDFKNKILALKWYNKASDGGLEKAKDAMKRLMEELEEDEGKQKRELQQMSNNISLPEIVLDNTGRESSSRNVDITHMQSDEQSMSILNEKFNALEQRVIHKMDESEQTYQRKITEMEKTSTEKDEKIRELEKMLELMKMGNKRLPKSKKDDRKNKSDATPGINAITAEDSRGLNYDIPNLSDNEGTSNDINYDSGGDSHSDLEINTDSNEDINYDSEADLGSVPNDGKDINYDGEDN